MNIRTKSTIVLALGLCAGTLTVSAAVLEADSQTSTGFTVSSTDLINGVLPAVTGSLGPDEGVTDGSGTGSPLTNGLFGDPGVSAGDAGNVVSIHDGVTLTYTLALSGPGYTITGINTYTGWRDHGRDGQAYDVLYSTVGAPSTFLLLATVGYNPSTGGDPSDTAVFLTDTTGTLATSVAKIKFSFPSTENGYVGYRELDVFGFTQVPEPSTLMLLSLGLAGTAWGYRRMKK